MKKQFITSVVCSYLKYLYSHRHNIKNIFYYHLFPILKYFSIIWKCWTNIIGIKVIWRSHIISLWHQKFQKSFFSNTKINVHKKETDFFYFLELYIFQFRLLSVIYRILNNDKNQIYCKKPFGYNKFHKMRSIDISIILLCESPLFKKYIYFWRNKFVYFCLRWKWNVKSSIMRNWTFIMGNSVNCPITSLKMCTYHIAICIFTPK